MNTISRWFLGFFAAMALASLGGCDDPLGPGVERYDLARVNGRLLPAVSADGIIETVSGTLELKADGTLAMVVISRCAGNPPPGTGCELYDGGRQAYSGRYSRNEGWIRIGEAQFAAAFTNATVVMQIGGCPPSHGFCPSESLEFER